MKILVDWIFPLFGAVAILGVVYSGILFMMSAGNPDKISKARRALLYSIVAVILVALSFAIVKGLQRIITREII